MKSRDDFIKSVWEKAEAAQAEEARRHGHGRWTHWAAAAAACMLLVAGAAGLGGPQAVYDSIFGVGSDQAYMDDAGEAAGSIAANHEDGSTEIELQDKDEFETTVTNQGNTLPSDPGDSTTSAMPGMSYDGAFVPDGLDDKALYDELRKHTDAAEEALDSEAGNLMGYYCLPVGIEIESCGGDEAWAMYASSEEEVLKYMKWFYSLPEEQVLTAEEFESLEDIPTGYYKFTMDQSWGADTEGVDIVYWILGYVSLP